VITGAKDILPTGVYLFDGYEVHTPDTGLTAKGKPGEKEKSMVKKYLSQRNRGE